jgi:hypothetical protein
MVVTSFTMLDARKEEDESTCSPPPSYRYNRPLDMGSVLLPALKPCLQQYGFWRHELVLEWPQIVGDTFAAYSVPRTLRFPGGGRTDGVLVVATTSTMAAVMHYSVMPILDRINTYFGYNAVAGLKFQHLGMEYFEGLRKP